MAPRPRCSKIAYNVIKVWTKDTDMTPKIAYNVINIGTKDTDMTPKLTAYSYLYLFKK